MSANSKGRLIHPSALRCGTKLDFLLVTLYIYSICIFGIPKVMSATFGKILDLIAYELSVDELLKLFELVIISLSQWWLFSILWILRRLSHRDDSLPADLSQDMGSPIPWEKIPSTWRAPRIGIPGVRCKRMATLRKPMITTLRYWNSDELCWKSCGGVAFACSWKIVSMLLLSLFDSML